MKNSRKTATPAEVAEREFHGWLPPGNAAFALLKKALLLLVLWPGQAQDLPALEKTYEEQVRANPTAGNWQRLGLVRHLQNHCEAAIPAFREALRLDAKLWTSDLFLGICLHRGNQFNLALAALVAADRLAPVSIIGWARRASR